MVLTPIYKFTGIPKQVPPPGTIYVVSERKSQSVVELKSDGFIYKTQPKHLTQNEWYALFQLSDTLYVPKAELAGIETIKMEWIEREEITDPGRFVYECGRFLVALADRGLRHGDLTEYAVIPRGNIPVVIDWGESRLVTDPRPDKRAGGDSFWLRKTIKKLVGDNYDLG